MEAWGIGALYAGAFASTSLVEYVWHAHVGHGKRPDKSRDDHLAHHANAREVAPPWIEMKENAPRIGMVLVAMNVVIGFVAGLAVSLPISLGLVSGYVFVTLYHAQMHERPPASRYERWMWRFHWYHHAANARVNFGLTNPVFDFVFGTAVVPDVVEVHERIAPEWLRAASEVPGIRLRRASQSGPSS